MRIGKSKARADRLAGEAEAALRARRQHTFRAVHLLRQRIASPPGLILCFGAGVAAGHRPRPAPRGSHEADDERTGWVHRLVDGSAGGRLARLAAAMILRAAVTAVVARLRTEPPGEDADEDEDEDSGEVVPSL